MGPTASGKTALACRLVDDCNAEIISVDSAMIYRGMNIGTATPTQQELRDYPHHCINLIDPAERYSVSKFIDDCLAAIADIRQRGKRPVLAGGTMMYFHCLQHGLAATPEIDPAIMETLTQQLAEQGLQALYDELLVNDPVSAAVLKPTDSQRVVRAVAVQRSTGRALSDWQQHTTEVRQPHRYIDLALVPNDRAVLHGNIAARFDAMLMQGFMEEVESLYSRGDLNEDLPSIRSVGYRQAWQFLQGEICRTEMRERSIIATRQLAKRQLTWIRNKWSDAFTLTDTSDASYAKIIDYLQTKKWL